MKQLVIADLAKCGECALDDEPPCVKAFPAWGVYGKVCYADSDDKEIIAGTTAVYNACLRGAVMFKRV